MKLGEMGLAIPEVDAFGREPKVELPDELCREDHRELPTDEGFDWQGIAIWLAGLNPGTDRSQPLHLVVFRALQKDGVEERAHQLDEAAYKEIDDTPELSPALLFYFPGQVVGQKAVSFCVWSNAETAHKSMRGPMHQLAVNQAPELYDEYTIEIYNLQGDGQLDHVHEMEFINSSPEQT